MPVNKEAYLKLKEELDAGNVSLIAVSKTKPINDIKELYDLGHRDFGENYVQELVEKSVLLPGDIRWHYIGHLQTNKVKQIAGFVQLIHGVDSLRLLQEIDKQGLKAGRIIDCLLQVHIAQEETKFGLSESELERVLKGFYKLRMANVRINGLMGMASFTEDMNKVREEFRKLKELFDNQNRLLATSVAEGLPKAMPDSRLPTLSMGMSSDYKVAVEEGSNMVRIGSLLFGERE